MTRSTRSSLTQGTLPAAACFAITLLVLTMGTSAQAAEEQGAATCDCSCDRYVQLIDQSPSQSPIEEDQRWACGGACAIAWMRCEQRDVLVDSENDESDGGLKRTLPLQASAGPDLN